MQQFVADIEAANATLVAISPQKPEYSRKIRSTQKLTFDLLWDKENVVAEKFGLRFELPDDLIELYRDSLNINLKLYHGNTDWTLPIPARFLVDTTGTIRYAESSADITKRPDPDDLMEVLIDVARQSAT